VHVGNISLFVGLCIDIGSIYNADWLSGRVGGREGAVSYQKCHHHLWILRESYSIATHKDFWGIKIKSRGIRQRLNSEILLECNVPALKVTVCHMSMYAIISLRFFYFSFSCRCILCFILL